MTDNKEEEKEKGRLGSLSDNDFSQVQKIMSDNNLPHFYSTNIGQDEDNTEEEEDDDTETEE